MSVKSLTHEQLLSLLQAGDTHAYTEIFETYHQLLLTFAYRFLQDEDEAHDIVQEVFMALWQKRETLRLTTSLSGYLYTSVRNRIYDHLAHKKVVTRYVDGISANLEAAAGAADERLIEKELAALVERELLRLPAKARESFMLRRHQELEYAEIGQQLNISENAAKQQVYNAARALRLKISSMMLFLW